MEIVAGLSLRNLKPRVWDPESPYYIPELRAVMVSYADFLRMPSAMYAATVKGIRAYLDVPADVKVYLDNGAFYLIGRNEDTRRSDYGRFVRKTQPDWRPVPRDYIPTPAMTSEEQHNCLKKTMAVNRRYRHDGYVPVIHVSQVLEEYVAAILGDDRLSAKPAVALGGLVPNLLRASKARPFQEVLDGLWHARHKLAGKKLHLFGVGGTATLHIAALLGMNSTDSSGWRNLAARGIIQLPGRGDRVVAELGKWRGRRPDSDEWAQLRSCTCPACRSYGLSGLMARGIDGFCNRATHNLWVLLEESRQIQEHLIVGTYADWYKDHLCNSTYSPLVERLVGSSRFPLPGP